MMAFWIIAGVMVAVVLAFLVPPFLSKRTGGGIERKQMNVELYREQLTELDQDLQSATLSPDQYDQTKSELEQRMLEDAAAPKSFPQVKARPGYLVAGMLALLVPGVAIGLYLKLGSPQAFNGTIALQAPPSMENVPPDQMDMTIGKFVARLTDRLKQTPDDGESWALLSRSYVALRKYPEAVDAFQHATKIMKSDASLWADYADALAMAQGRRLEGKPEELIQHALVVDPNNGKALYLAGTVAFNRKDFQTAIKHWEKLRALLPPASDSAKEISMALLEAKALSGDKAALAQMRAAARGGLDQIQPVSAPSDKPAVAGASGTVSGVVSISSEMKAKLSPDAKLFVYARAVNGPKMPLAILNKTASELPLKFSLNDAMAMMPNMKISNFEQVQIVARVSKSGSAAPQSGDLEGLSKPVKVGSEDLQVEIDHVIP